VEIVTSPPQSQQIVDYLKNAIRQGRVRPGDRLESIRDLAVRFGVGRQVVLSAFQKLQQEDLVETQVGRGTFVRHSALARNGKLNVAFCVRKSGLAWFFNRNVFLGCAVKAEEKGINLTIAPGDAESSPVSWCIEHGMDGLLVTGQVDDSLVRELNHSGLPYLVIGTYDLKEPANVLTSNSDGTGKAIREAFERFEIRRPGVIAGDPAFHSTRNLLERITDTVRARGIEIPSEYLYAAGDEDGYKGMSELMNLPEPPDMLLIVGRAFPGAARYLFETGIKRPVIISPPSDEQNPLYPELIDIPLPLDSTELGRRGMELIESCIKTGKFEHRMNYINMTRAK